MPIKLGLDKLNKIDAVQPASIVTLHKSAGQLSDSHLQEWLASGVDKEIIRLNVVSISGKEPVIEALNLGDLNEYQLKRRYGSVLHGGWVCGNRLKPDKPRSIKGRPIKYETPIDGTCEPILLRLPETTWQAIAAKYGVVKMPGVDGWEWVKATPEIPVVVCEGVKKAGCVISQALTPAIALPGHNAAYEKDGDLRFKEFLHPKRKITLCFDQDARVEAAKSVAQTIKGISRRIYPGNKQPALAQLFITHWWSLEKGIDDLYSTQGEEAVKLELKSAMDSCEWVDTSFGVLGFEPDVTFNSPKWQPTEIPDSARLVVLIGKKGTGKTWQLEQFCLDAKENKIPSIATTHRIQLSQALAQRLGLTYISELDDKIDGAKNLTLCIDSLPKITPENFKGGLVIFDEACQQLEHFLIGDTCAHKRHAILKALKELAQIIIESGGRFVIADADMNSATVRFFMGILGEEKPFIIQNTYREPGYKCWVSDGKQENSKGNISFSPADIVGVAITKARKGEKIFIACTGQKEESKWGAQTLEGLFLQHGVDNVLRIDSDTVKDPNHPAFRATNNINLLCDIYQVIIATPSIGTGVSIENQLKFDLMCGIFTGVGSPDAVRQFLMRIRDTSTPRLIYCAEKGLNNQYLNLGGTETTVNNRIKELKDFQQTCLMQHDHEWSEEYSEVKHCNTVGYYFNNLIANRNNENKAFRKHVKMGLKSENVEVIEIVSATEVFSSEFGWLEISNEAADYREGNLEEYQAKLIAQKLLQKEDYEKLKSATELSENERLALRATSLSNRYGGIEITQELIEKDAAGWYDEIKLHYACTDGFEVQKNIQALIANSAIRKGEGLVIAHDFVARQKLLAQAEFIKGSEILELIDSEHIFNPCDETTINFYQDMIEQIPNINLIFNKEVNQKKYDSEEFDINLVAIITKLLGLQIKGTEKDGRKGKRKRVRVKGKQVDVYQFEFPDDGRDKVFAAWMVQDLEKQERWFKRKKDWEVRKIIGLIKEEMSVTEYINIQQNEHFNDAWERTKTETRIQIINRVDNFVIPEPTKIFINALDEAAIQNAFETINQWQTLAADSETFGNDKPNKKGVRKEALHKFKAGLRLLQISNADTVFTFDFGKRGSALREYALLNVKPYFNQICGNKKKTIIGHNLNFDVGIWRRVFDTNFECKFEDTLLGLQIFFGIYNGKNLWEGGFSLGNGVQKLLGIPMDKSEQKSDWGLELTPSQIDYAALDPHRNYWLAIRLKEIYQDPTKFGFAKLAQWDMRSAWELECECLAPLAEMEHEGLPVDISKLVEIKQLVETQIELILKKWDELNTGIKRPTMVAKLIPHLNQKYGLQLTKSDKQALGEYKELPEVEIRFTHSGLIQYLCRLNTLIKSAEQYGKIKTFYSPLSGSGRTSSGGGFSDIINIQSIPAKVDENLRKLNIPSIRSAFKAPPGYRYLVGDLAAAHARYAIDFSKDALGLIAMNDGAEVHSLFAINLAQCCPEKFKEKGLAEKFLSQVVTIANGDILRDFKNGGKVTAILKQSRDVSKNIFYGKLNLASWKRVQVEVKGQLKIVLTESEARAMSDVFSRLYPGIDQYCKDIVKKLELAQNQIWIDGKLFGIHVIENTGQRLLFDLKFDGEQITVPATNVVASTWSRTEATAMKKAMILCYKIFKKHPEWDAKVINIVHDELNVIAKTEYSVKAAKVLAWAMSRYFQKELKNGVKHGCVDFKNEHQHKYLLDNEGNTIYKEGKPMEDKIFETSVYSMIVDSWADK